MVATTRFDRTIWENSKGEVNDVQEMETGHLLNILKMLMVKPYKITSMVVFDIEKFYRPTSYVKRNWVIHEEQVDMSEISQMNAFTLREFALNSTFGQAAQRELNKRGINLREYLNMVMEFRDDK